MRVKIIKSTYSYPHLIEGHIVEAQLVDKGIHGDAFKGCAEISGRILHQLAPNVFEDDDFMYYFNAGEVEYVD
jgi:hypothetical protein